MENKVAITLSENFAKIDEAGLFENAATDSTSAYYVKNMELAEKEDDVMTRKTLVKMRSFDLNKESQKEKPMRKTKSFSSHLLLNIDELINRVAGSFEGTSAFLSNSHSDDEIRFLSSIYESSLPPESVTDVITLRNPKSGVSSPTGEEDSDSCSWRKIQIEPPFRIYLKFEDVNHKVKLKGNRNSGVEKSILQGVSGSVCPGEVLALMGPSGGGKTTLLNVLSGRVKNSGGTITYNDQLYTKSLKHRIGFVLQDDIAFPHLTVRETLTYSALLRLPNTLSREQKKARAMSVISELGLERCQNTMIGGTFVRGVSGGERKRVCIGNEILLNPSLLFLDEPTSGLDSTTALRIIQMLCNIAQAGKTVVTTIHQPSSRLFSKFDKLILLSNGCSLYFGKASEAMLYFSSIGCSPLTAMTPAEFLIDLANGNIKDKSIPSELEVKFLPGGECFEYNDGGPSPGDVHEYLLGAYELRASNMEKIRIGIPVIIAQNKRNAEECGATWSAQFSILFQRGLKERRHEYLSTLRVVQVISTAVIVGLLWWNSDASSTMKVQDQAILTSIFTFPQERTMLAKERSVGMYKLSAYLIARNTSDLPLDLLLPIVFLTIIYFMVGLKLTFPAFFLTLLSIFLSIIAAQGLGLAIGAAFMDVKKATTLASVTVMAFMLSGGFFIKYTYPVLFHAYGAESSSVYWIRYVSLNYHTYRLLLKIQYSCVGGTSRSEICDSAFIKAERLDHSATEAGAILAMIIGYRMLTYVLLRRMKLRNEA
ncbi:UNVERIFIED_CONTAM: ABC transporter G family member 22 [Sesamum radiatum]|uniref:ABC transporter G family member 22 n=1 Tax=Sesamum radiatum TaxID=300843 RepID=A0AAW2M5B4_SESRA